MAIPRDKQAEPGGLPSTDENAKDYFGTLKAEGGIKLNQWEKGVYGPVNPKISEEIAKEEREKLDRIAAKIFQQHYGPAAQSECIADHDERAVQRKVIHSHCNPEKSPAQRRMQMAIKEVCEVMADFLIEKNDSYGNSVYEPINIFSNISALEQINVRIDDKLNRLFYGREYPGDDTLKDLAGYYLLKQAVILCAGGEK